MRRSGASRRSAPGGKSSGRRRTAAKNLLTQRTACSRLSGSTLLSSSSSPSRGRAERAGLPGTPRPRFSRSSARYASPTFRSVLSWGFVSPRTNWRSPSTESPRRMAVFRLDVRVAASSTHFRSAASSTSRHERGSSGSGGSPSRQFRPLFRVAHRRPYAPPVRRARAGVFCPVRLPLPVVPLAGRGRDPGLFVRFVFGKKSCIRTSHDAYCENLEECPAREPRRRCPAGRAVPCLPVRRRSPGAPIFNARTARPAPPAPVRRVRGSHTTQGHPP